MSRADTARWAWLRMPWGCGCRQIPERRVPRAEKAGLLHGRDRPRACPVYDMEAAGDADGRVAGLTKRPPVRTGSKRHVGGLFESAGGGRWSFGVPNPESGLTMARDATCNKTGCSTADPPRDAAGMTGGRPAVPANDRLDGAQKGPGAAVARRNGGNGTPSHIRSAPMRMRHFDNNTPCAPKRQHKTA